MADEAVHDTGSLPSPSLSGCSALQACLPPVRRSTRTRTRAALILPIGLGRVNRAARAVAVVVRVAAWPAFDLLSSATSIGILVYVGNLARRGCLRKTVLVPGQLAVSIYFGSFALTSERSHLASVADAVASGASLLASGGSISLGRCTEPRLLDHATSGSTFVARWLGRRRRASRQQARDHHSHQRQGSPGSV